MSLKIQQKCIQETENYIEEYYERYDEDGRLERKYSKIEFLTTIRYVEKYLKKGMRIALHSAKDRPDGQFIRR